jgi:hypothetical protein
VWYRATEVAIFTAMLGLGVLALFDVWLSNRAPLLISLGGVAIGGIEFYRRERERQRLLRRTFR